MKRVIQTVVVMGSALLLAGCVDDFDTSQDYYSSNGNVTTYQSDALTGYNRDYQSRKQRDKVTTYSSTQTPGGYSSSQTSGNGGYSSSQTAPKPVPTPVPGPSASGYSSSASPSTSSAAPAAPVAATEGYASSAKNVSGEGIEADRATEPDDEESADSGYSSSN